MLLVDDRPRLRRRVARGPPAASRRRCPRHRRRIRRHSSARSPSPRPEWTRATRTSRSARRRSIERQRQGDLGDQQQRAATGPERVGDRLDVDRRLAAARDALEQERRRVGRRHGGADEGERLDLGRQQVRRGRAAAAQPDGPAGKGTAGPLPDLGLEQAAPHEAGDRRRPVSRGELGTRRRPRRPRARPSRRARPPGAGRAGGPGFARPPPGSRRQPGQQAVTRIQRS